MQYIVILFLGWEIHAIAYLAHNKLIIYEQFDTEIVISLENSVNQASILS